MNQDTALKTGETPAVSAGHDPQFLNDSMFRSAPLRLRDGEPMVMNDGSPITEIRFTEALRKLAVVVNPVTKRFAEQHRRVPDQWDASASHRDTEQLNGLGDNPAVCRRHLIDLEQSAIRKLIEVAESTPTDRSAAIRTFASHSAEAAQRLQDLKSQIHEGFRWNAAVPNSNAGVIEMSWRQHPGNFEEAVLTACEYKRNLHGRVQLVIWNDIDQNLTFDCTHNQECPGVSYAKMAYAKFGREMLESTVFPGIYGHITDADGVGGAWGRHLYRQIGASIFKPQVEPYGVLPGVEESFAFANEHKLDMRLLTRNLRLVGDGVGEVLGVPHDRIYGRTVQDHASTVKDLVVMQNLLRNPYTVHVVVDDGDSSLINAVVKGSYPDNSGVHKHAFLMVRSAVGSRTYELEDACKQHGIPHGAHGDDYYPVLSLLKQYVARGYAEPGPGQSAADMLTVVRSRDPRTLPETRTNEHNQP